MNVQPEWFQRSLAQQPTDHSFDLDGTRIHYRHWQNSGKPGLLLVHGHAAHSRWWDFIAPSFAEEFDIAAIDLSGSGDSDHRDEYSARLFAREMIACIEAASLQTATIIGHSFGGSMARVAAHLHHDAVARTVIVDSAIPRHRGSRTPPPMPRSRTRYYPTVEEGIRRFRLRPPQPVTNRYIVDYIARHSLKETAEGWCFKYDSAVFAKMPADDSLPAAGEMIASLAMPFGLIYGEESRFFPPEVVESLDDLIDRHHVIGVTGAYHHVFLDQPQAFVEALSAMLERLGASPSRQ